MRKIKVILLSITDFTDSRNGGGLWAANLLNSMSRVHRAELTIVSVGPAPIQAANDELVSSLGMTHSFIPFRPDPASAGGGFGRLNRSARNLLGVLAEKYYFPWEREARRQPHVDAAFMDIVNRVRPDVIVINYLFAALFVPSVFRLSTPLALITLNDEAAFQRELKSQGGPAGDKLRHKVVRWLYRRGNGIANERVRRFESRVYARCAGAVALTRSDLPADLPATFVQAVLPPIMPECEPHWSYSGRRCLFFVGNINYYPNRLAIQWLCTRFAPELARAAADIRLNIIGAANEHVPADWRAANVNLMGFSNKEEVIRQLTTADLFVAPIANTFGAKIKLAECVAHGTPFLATAAAMSGLSFLQDMPLIDLTQPRAAAGLAANLMGDPQSLLRLGDSIRRQANLAREQQLVEWSAFFERLAGQ